MKKIYLFFLVVFIHQFAIAQIKLQLNIPKGTKVKTEYVMGMEMKFFGKSMNSKNYFYTTLDVLQNLKDSMLFQTYVTDMKVVVKEKDEEKVMTKEELMESKQGESLKAIFESKPSSWFDNSGKKLHGDEMSDMMSSSFMVYPDRELKVGDTWHQENDMEASGIKVKIASDFTLKEIKETEVILTAVFTLDGDKDEENKASLIVDRATGLIKSNTTFLKMKMMGMKFKTTLTSNSTW
jgi:hypothetical protein